MIDLTPKEQDTLTRLMAQGMSKGQALIKMGKAVRKEVKVEPVKKASKPKEVDPVKDWLMRFITVPLEGMVGNQEMPYEVSCVVRDGTKSIGLTIEGESYTLSLTTHRPTKK